MKKVQQGFTLIELMIVVAIIGILAAIAIPAYQDYTIRAKVSECVTSLGTAKTSISEYYQSQGAMPDTAAKAGFSTAALGNCDQLAYSQTSTSEAIVAIEVKETLGGSITESADAFRMTGTGSGAGVTWACTPGDTGGGNAIPAKYLPASCR